MSGDTFRPVPAIRLAAAFAYKLRQRLTAADVAVIVERNRHEADPRVCHSHDFCDANMVMEAAWRALAITDDGPDPASDDHAELWNSAWRIARRTEFATEQASVYAMEFPPEFHPSADEVVRLTAAGLIDTSWHNDECPSWSWHVPEYAAYKAHVGEVTVTMFVDAPKPRDREAENGPRFQVGYGPCFTAEAHAPLAWLYEGDDLDTAIRIGQAAHTDLLARLRKRAAAQS